MTDPIKFRGIATHNLKNIDVDLPRLQLTAVTGVSGCGKSSFAFDTVFREGERRYLSALSSSARRLAGKLQRPPMASVKGLGPAVAVGQRASTPNARSTVGTSTGLWDLVRLLYSRLASPSLSRAQLSFNDEAGQCPICKGLGVSDWVDPDLIVANPQLSLRSGALVPTLKNGYTVYSQVTVDVMNDVCRAHGFDVDTPWQELSEDHKKVIFYGSKRLLVPFGKHSLESRMKWSGITAKPRDEGHYKGLIPVIEETLLRNRNDNILRFVRTVTCKTCEGSRLGPEARALELGGLSPVQAANLPIRALRAWQNEIAATTTLQAEVLTTIQESTEARSKALLRLGLGHLPLGRSASSLSSGELQRIRLAQQLDDDLAGLTYVLDEPGVDLHPIARHDLQDILQNLVQGGNTVLTVEHDPDMVRRCAHVLDIGPGPGQAGGELLFAGHPADLAKQDSATGHALSAAPRPWRSPPSANHPRLWIRGATARNLRGDDVPLLKGALNVVCGVSGAGKSTLVGHVLGPALQRILGRTAANPGTYSALEGIENIKHVITLDQRPLGRTPRSNPATYTKLFDVIRAQFAKTEAAKAAGFNASRFSFNTAGGRCPTCEGAGIIRIGMHSLGDVSSPCPACDGRRFDSQTLAIKLLGLSIHEVLDLEVDEARALLHEVPDAVRMLDALQAVGLGYLALGHPATDLSGGEAQRVRLATELAKPVKGRALYVLDEPTKGLHPQDLGPVLQSFERLVEAGHTLVVVEHNPEVWRAAQWLIELGPGAAEEGGGLVFAGPPREILKHETSATARVLRGEMPRHEVRNEVAEVPAVHLSGVRTHNLKGVQLTLPTGSLTVIAGPSGSGKSSLAFDTLAAEAGHRTGGRLGAHIRRRLKQLPRPDFDVAQGLTPVIALRQQTPTPQPRSTVGTLTEVQDFLRLLFSRLSVGEPVPASALSFNDEIGACPRCTGLGFQLKADPERLVSHPDRPVLDGACAGSRVGKNFTDPNGQHAAVMLAAAERSQIDISGAFSAMPEATQRFILSGDGLPSLSVVWAFKRGKRSGEHGLESEWIGLLGLLDDEYARTHLGKGSNLESLMRKVHCPACLGARLGPPALRAQVHGHNLAEISMLNLREVSVWLQGLPNKINDQLRRSALSALLLELQPRLQSLIELGLGHLHPHRGADTLSAGELMRVHLAAQIGAPMTGVTFVLDEPTRGLHPKDVEGLLAALRRLADFGNTVVVIDHGQQAQACADQLVVLGPGGGPEGGQIMYAGEPAQYAMPENRATDVDIEFSRVSGSAQPLRIRGADTHNLKNLDLDIPSEGITVVAGPSGSGKSTLVLAELLKAHRPGFEATHVIKQSPLSGGWSSTVATAVGLFDALRTLYAKSPEAKAAGITKASFALGQGTGRCPACKGTGSTSVVLDFLADARAVCATCQGRRYRHEVLGVKVRGLNLAEVLDLTITQARGHFASHASITKTLSMLESLGLGHLSLGRAAPTLSGGEAQRTRLAGHLTQPLKGRTLFILDEPSQGLDSAGVRRVQNILRNLANAGHGVVLVTHHLEFIASADHVVELGPGGGPEGGRIVFQGSGQGLKRADTATGRALRSHATP